MPHNGKGPADAIRWAFYKIKPNSPIVPSLPAETKCFLRQLAIVYREAMTSKHLRAMRVGLQILWHHLGNIFQAEAE
jgi:hypothetical protein